MAKQGLQLFGGDWTERKLDALKQYLKAYGTALKKQPFERIYIDAFAGTGYREQRNTSMPGFQDVFIDENPAEAEPQQFLDGSACIALRTKPAFDQYIFIELDPYRASELAKLKVEFPELADKIEIRQQDANVAIHEICNKWNRRTQRGVLFLDPFGLQVDWVTIEAIAKTAAIDTWILFPFAINRLLTKFQTDIPLAWRDRLTRLFGSEEWFDRFYFKRTIPDIFAEEPEVVIEKRRLTLEGLGAYYKERLKKIFPVVAPNPKILVNSRGVPIFQLFFAAGNTRGGEIALRIAKHILDKI